MKKKICLVILILFSLFIASCENIGNGGALKAPTITMEGKTATWNKISGASGYKISINNKFTTVDKNVRTYEIDYYDTIKVCALGNGSATSDSDWSEKLYFEYPNPINTGQSIEKEYYELIKDIKDNVTTFNFTAKIIANDEITYFSASKSYNVDLLVEVDGVEVKLVLCKTKDGSVKNIDGLDVGSDIQVQGKISFSSSKKNNCIIMESPIIEWGSKSSEVNFFMINETHGALTDGNGWSMGRVDSIVTSLESNNGDYILIQNGDAFQGTYISGETYGKAMIDAMNVMEFDCMVIGNHEFDWGLDKIARFADGDTTNGEANFPFLGANIYYRNTNNRPNWIDPYVIINYEDLKVGIIGVIGYGQESSILGSNVAGYEFKDPVNIIKEYSYELRNELNCDVVVVAAHDYSTYLNNSIAAFDDSSEIDAIFCGHTHESVNKSIVRNDGKYIPVVQNRDKNITTMEVVINLNEKNEYNGYITTIYEPSTYQSTNRVEQVISQYQDLVNEASESLGYTNNYIYKSTLGSYATDAMLTIDYSEYNFGDIDVSIINTGGVRATIDDGDITRSEIFEVFPFNNKIVIVNLSGALIKSLYSNNSSYLYIDLVDEFENYTELDDNTIYQLAVIDYVFEGVYYDEFDNLTEMDYIATEIILRDIVIEYIDNIY